MLVLRLSKSFATKGGDIFVEIMMLITKVYVGRFIPYEYSVAANWNSSHQ